MYFSSDGHVSQIAQIVSVRRPAEFETPVRDRAGTFERQVVVAIKVQLENAAVGFVLRMKGKSNLLLGLPVRANA